MRQPPTNASRCWPSLDQHSPSVPSPAKRFVINNTVPHSPCTFIDTISEVCDPCTNVSMACLGMRFEALYSRTSHTCALIAAHSESSACSYQRKMCTFGRLKLSVRFGRGPQRLTLLLFCGSQTRSQAHRATSEPFSGDNLVDSYGHKSATLSDDGDSNRRSIQLAGKTGILAYQRRRNF